MPLQDFALNRDRLPAKRETDSGEVMVPVLLFGTDGAPLTALGNEPEEAAYPAAVLLDGSSDLSSYASAIANGSALGIRLLEVFNITDGWLEVSFDGGTTTHLYVPRGGMVSRDLGSNGLIETSAVHVRELAALPITGGRIALNVVWTA